MKKEARFVGVSMLGLFFLGCGSRQEARIVASSPVQPSVEVTVEVTVEPPAYAIGENLWVHSSAEIRLDGPTGPIVGHAYPGARMTVISIDQGWLEVGLEQFGHRRVGNSHQGLLTGFVSSTHLGREEASVAPPLLKGRVVENFRRALSTAPFEEDWFANTSCGVLRVLEDRDDPDGQSAQKLVQYREGVEIFGWSDRPVQGLRGDRHCPKRVIYADRWELEQGAQPEVPSGYVLRDPERAALAASQALKTGSRFYWLLDEVEGTICREYQIGEQELVSEPYVKERRVARERHVARRDGAWIELSGPHWYRQEPDGWSRWMSSRCLYAYEVVEAQSDRLLVVNGRVGGSTDSAPSTRPYAYHPKDVEPWFLSHEACLEAAQLRNANPPSIEPQQHAEVIPNAHTGC